ncbi:MAG TPA: DNA primase [bacterium]|nr:DNA primase [bacterium]
MAGKIPEHIIQEIKDRVSIIEVVGDYVRLTKDGANYKGLCPFHQEKTPSFKVHEGKGIYKCFGCGEAGNIFNFLMKQEGMSFIEAAQRLAARAGISLPREEPKPEDLEREQNQGRLFRVNEAAAKFFHDSLKNSAEARIARDYLNSRGYGDDVIARYLLGYSPESWDATLNALKAQGISLADIHAAGLSLERDRGGFYDRFRGRLMFPIHDVQGRVRGFGARIMKDDDAGQPKYINSPETLIFKKGQGFYGLYQAKDEIRKQGRVIVVEGYFDQIALDHAGIKDAVATLGTALTPDHARMIRRYTQDVYLVFDADEAGKKAALRSIEPFLESGLSPRIVLIPDGKDPDDFLRAHSAAEFEKLLDIAPPLISHYLDQLVAAAGSTPSALSKAVWEAAELLAKVRDPIERNAFAERLARRTGVPLPQVQARLRRPTRKTDAPGPEGPEGALAAAVSYPRAEAELVSLVVHHPETAARVRESGVAGKFQDPEIAALLSALLDQDREGRMDPGALLPEISDPALSDLVSHAIFDKDPFGDKALQVVDEIIARVHKAEIESRLISLRAAIEDAQQKGDEGQWRTLLEKQQDLLEEKKGIATGRAG